ncbi:hypothetical protein ACIODW_06020 [Streptomyces sp. NPDC087897]|uniref:hypothetical protein n=1 Tax=Streptomyces sp. NPDC087897 TaxID=3365817 RepID=UPI003818EC4C
MSTTGEAEPVVVARFRTWSACGSGLLYCYDPRRPPHRADPRAILVLHGGAT